MEQHRSHLATLRFNLAVLLTCIAVLLLSAAAWLVWRNLLDTRAVALEQNAVLARALDEHISGVFATLAASTERVVQSPLLREHMADTPEASLHMLLAEVSQSLPQVKRIALYNERGVGIAHSQEFPFKRINVYDREYFRYHMANPGQGLFVSKPVSSRVDNAAILPVSRRIDHRDGSFAGVLVIVFDYSYLQRFYQALELDGDRTVMLLRNDAEILLRYPQGGFEPDRGHQAVSSLFDAAMAKVRDGMVEEPLAGEGPVNLLSFRRTDGLPLIVTVGIDKDRLLGGWRGYLYGMLLVAMLLVGVLAAIWRLLSHQIERLARTEQQLLRIQFVVDNSADMLFWVDGDGRFRYVNDSACQRLGYTREQLLGMSVPDIDPNYPLAAHLQLFQRLRRTHSDRLDSVLQARDGTHFPVEIVLSYFQLDEQELLSASIRDMSERVSAQIELSRLSERLRLAQRAVHMGVWNWDIATGRIEWDEVQRCIYGSEAGQFGGTFEHWRELIHPSDRPRFDAELQGVLRGDLGLDIQFRVVRPNGQVRFLRAYGQLERDDRGQPLRLVGINLDVTEHRRAETLVENMMRLTASAVGDSFFRSLVIELCGALGVQYAFVAELVPRGEPRSATTVAVCTNGEIAEGTEWDLDGTPSGDVCSRGVCVIAQGATRLYPHDETLNRSAIESYVGVLLKGAHDEPNGVLAVMHDKPIPDIEQARTLLTILATRARAELERRQAEVALRAEKLYSEQILFNSPAIICNMAPDGRILRINQAFQAITGFVPQDAIGRNWVEVFAPGGRSQPGERFLLDTSSLGASELELTMRTRSGELRSLMWKTAARVGASGKIDEIIAVGVDSTARKSAEAEIRKLNAELEQRVVDRTAELQATIKELESFSYSVSHDLRTPLRSIAGFSAILREEYYSQLDQEGRDYLNRIAASTERLSQLIDDMLNLSRVSRQSFQPRQIDLAPMAGRVIADLRFGDPQREVAFTCPPHLPAWGDERLVLIVLENLLRNAWKFTNKQPEAQIELGMAERAGKAVYLVRDNGAGFDMQYVEKLFGAFQRLHDGKDFEGTGIGLAIVQRIIHRHGGEVWAEGALGRGATFFFTLPRGPVLHADSQPGTGDGGEASI